MVECLPDCPARTRPGLIQSIANQRTLWLSCRPGEGGRGTLLMLAWPLCFPRGAGGGGGEWMLV